MEKLNVKIKSDLKELDEIDDLQEIIIEIIYEYICEKQTEIIFKINWKMQIINPKHFIDHFIRILPDFRKLQLNNIRQHFTLNEQYGKDIVPHVNNISRKMISLYEVLNEEIEECIDSVAKLAPLVSCYIEYDS
jgi:hypothetical protein